MPFAPGTTARLYQVFTDADEEFIDPPDPSVDILDPAAVAVVTDAIPVNDSVGHYHYDYDIAADADLGTYTQHVTATIDGQVVVGDEDFEVEVEVVAGSNAGEYGPCADWCDANDLCSPVDDYSFPAGVIADSIEIASNLLYVLSGRQFPGTCSTTVRPCSRRCTESYPNYGLGMVTSCGCRWVYDCGCTTLEQIELGSTPINSITEVVVDGVTLNAARYRVDDWRWLVRLPDADGTNPGWPGCQRLDLDSTEDETFEVTFTYGRAVPPEGVRAAAILAGEIAAACVPETMGHCTLSQRVTSITRQGVTVALDSLDSIAQDLTGLPMVDMFLRAHNPGRLRRRGRVFSPDIGPHVRRIGT